MTTMIYFTGPSSTIAASVVKVFHSPVLLYNRSRLRETGAGPRLVLNICAKEPLDQAPSAAATNGPTFGRPQECHEIQPGGNRGADLLIVPDSRLRGRYLRVTSEPKHPNA